jgi:hypothetical protein
MIKEGDKRFIACNFRKGTKIARKGAIAYVLWPNYGGGNDRIPLLVRSRSGRWVEKWEAMSRLENFRFKTIPPEHPLYNRDYGILNDACLQSLQEACLREHATRATRS